MTTLDISLGIQYVAVVHTTLVPDINILLTYIEYNKK